MSRWSRVIRGMLGTGLTFSVGVGVVGSIMAAVALLLSGGGDIRELARIVFACAVWAFPMGVAFSGVLSLTARGRSFEELSIPRFAALGTGAGLLLFGVLALNAWDAWSISTALVNASLFAFLGGGSATAVLVLARKAGPALESGDEPSRMAVGDGPSVLSRVDRATPAGSTDPAGRAG